MIKHKQHNNIPSIEDSDKESEINNNMETWEIGVETISDYKEP